MIKTQIVRNSNSTGESLGDQEQTLNDQGTESQKNPCQTARIQIFMHIYIYNVKCHLKLPLLWKDSAYQNEFTLLHVS